MKKFKYGSLSAPAKASIWFVITNFTHSGIAIIFTPLFTRVMTPADYGVTNIYLSSLNLMLVLVTLSVASTIYNRGLNEFKEDVNRYSSTVLGLTTTSVTFFYVLSIVFRSQFITFIPMSSYLIDFMFLNLILYPAMLLWTMRQRYHYKYQLATFIMISSDILSQLVAYIALNKFKNYNPADVKIICGALVPMTVYAVMYIHTFVQGKKFFDAKYWKYMLLLCLPLIPHYLSANILSQADRLMIANYQGTAKVAIYSVSYSAASIVSIFWSAMNASFFPWTIRKLEIKGYKDIGHVANLLIVLCAVVCIGLICVAPEVMAVLAPKAYYEGVWVIPPVAMGVFFISIYSLFANIEFYHKKTIFIMIASILAASLKIGLNFLLLPTFGYVAASYTTLASYILLAAVHYYFMKTVEKNKIYNMRFILILIALLFGISAVVMSLYNYAIIRYSIIFAIVALVFIYRKKIMQTFSNLKSKGEVQHEDSSDSAYKAE